MSWIEELKDLLYRTLNSGYNILLLRGAMLSIEKSQVNITPNCPPNQAQLRPLSQTVYATNLPGSFSSAEEKLRAIGVGASVGHGENA